MTPNEKDYMQRYIYQVIRRLPKKQRDEVRMELEELISDMYADKRSMEDVLTQLGDPAEFAKQYQNGRQYLIGPEYFETYLWFVKVVLLCTAVPVLVVSLVNALGQTPCNHFAECRRRHNPHHCGRLDYRHYRYADFLHVCVRGRDPGLCNHGAPKNQDRDEESRNMVCGEPVGRKENHRFQMDTEVSGVRTR